MEKSSLVSSETNFNFIIKIIIHLIGYNLLMHRASCHLVRPSVIHNDKYVWLIYKWNKNVTFNIKKKYPFKKA